MKAQTTKQLDSRDNEKYPLNSASIVFLVLLNNIFNFINILWRPSRDINIISVLCLILFFRKVLKKKCTNSFNFELEQFIY